MPEVKRQLAAIMFTDIVGYTSLMGQDEDSAFDVLRKNRELHRSAFAKYNGKFIKELGDGILASFDSVGDAVFCAREIQLQVANDPHLSLRIGIHLGDVVFEDGDAHGDGVNIASRLTGVAKAGHILISESVYKNVSNKKDIQTRFINKMNLKNVAEPVNVYAVGDNVQMHKGDYSSAQNKTIVYILFAAVLILASLVIYLLLGYSISDPQLSKDVMKLGIKIEGEPTYVAISKDGTKLVYKIRRDGYPLFLRHLNQAASIPISGTELAFQPFFAPDGNSIGFVANNSLFKTSLANSQPVKLASNIVYSSGGYWTPDDTIVISYNNGTKAGKIHASGGLFQDMQVQGPNMWGPVYLPEEKIILSVDEDYNIVVSQPSSMETTYLVKNAGWQVRYMDPGYLTHIFPGRLFVTPVENTTLRPLGVSVPVVSPVKSNVLNRGTVYDISSNGTLVYSAEPPRDKGTFRWVDLTGNTGDSLSLPSDYYGAFSLSPDQTKLAYGMEGPESEIWIYDLKTAKRIKITSSGRNQYPVWTPDGEWITYSSFEFEKGWEIYKQNLNATSRREQLTNSGHMKISGAWSPDGVLLSYYEITKDDGYNMFLLDTEKNEVTEPFYNTPFLDSQLRFSPDGNYVTYLSLESGAAEVYVETYPPTGKRWQISNGSAVDPIWSPNGDKIYYRTPALNPDPKYYSVRIRPGEVFSYERPERLFGGHHYVDVFDRSFDVSADGKQLLVLETGAMRNTDHFLEVILNWQEELKHLVPRE